MLPAFGNQVLDLQPAERDTPLHHADGRSSITSLFGVGSGARRHEPWYDPATPSDDDFFADLYPVEQLTQLVLGLGGSDLAPAPRYA